MRTIIFYLSVILPLTIQGCSKFEWSTFEQYEIRSSKPIHVRSSTPRIIPANPILPSDPVSEAPVTRQQPDPPALPDAAPSDTPQSTQDTPPEAPTDLPADLQEENAAPTDTPQTKPPCIDLNHADRETLMKLPGVGAQRADTIIAKRTKRLFKHKRDITKIKGIGKKTYNRMKDQLCDL